MEKFEKVSTRISKTLPELEQGIWKSTRAVSIYWSNPWTSRNGFPKVIKGG